MADNTKALIKGIKARLAGQSAVTDLVSTRIYTRVPHNPTYPYIWFKVTAEQDDTKTGNGQSCEILFNFFSNSSSHTQNLDIGAAVYNALHEQEANISLDAGNLTLLHYKGLSDNIIDSDGVTLIGVMGFDALLN